MRSWAARGALVAAGLVVGLLAAEGTSRLVGAQAGAELFFAAPESAPDGLYVTDRSLLMVPQPGFSGTAQSLDRAVELRINSLGLRGPEPADGATGGWLVVGDSFTMASQVDADETLSHRLGQALGVPTWNAGVDGYSTWQATGRYTQLADQLDPDGVLLVLFLGNDLHDNESFPHQLRRARGVISGRPIPRPQVSLHVRLLSRWSHAYARFRVWRRSQATTGMAEAHRKRWWDTLRIFSSQGQRRLDQLMPATTAALSELIEAADQRNDRLVVVLVPPAFSVHTERLAPTFSMVDLDPLQTALDAPAKAVAASLVEIGVQVCDLADPLMAASDPGPPLYFTWDGHWTATGHQVAATAVAACIQEEQ